MEPGLRVKEQRRKEQGLRGDQHRPVGKEPRPSLSGRPPLDTHSAGTSDGPRARATQPPCPRGASRHNPLTDTHFLLLFFVYFLIFFIYVY